MWNLTMMETLVVFTAGYYMGWLVAKFYERKIYKGYFVFYEDDSKG